MTRMRRRILSVVAVLLLGMTGVVGNATSAYAAGCPIPGGRACYPVDPYKTGCVESSSLYHLDTNATVWNKYAYNCNANWARGNLSSQAVQNHYWLYVTISTEDQPFQTTHVGPYNGTLEIWTDMVDGTNKTMACAKVFKDQAMTVMVDQVCQEQ